MNRGGKGMAFEDSKMMRVGEVAERLQIHKASVFKWAQRGEFPPPIKIHCRLSAWPEEEVETIRAAYIAGADKDEIKELVKRLREARARHYEALKRLTKTDKQPENETE